MLFKFSTFEAGFPMLSIELKCDNTTREVCHPSTFSFYSFYPLKALSASRQPSYELRHNQVGSLFLSGIDAYGNQLAFDSFQVTNLYYRIDISCNGRLIRRAKNTGAIDWGQYLQKWGHKFTIRTT